MISNFILVEGGDQEDYIADTLLVQGHCGEHHGVTGSECNTTHNTCVRGRYLNKGHGVMTGMVNMIM